MCTDVGDVIDIHGDKTSLELRYWMNREAIGARRWEFENDDVMCCFRAKYP